MRFRVFLYTAIAVVWALSVGLSQAAPLRLGYDVYVGPPENLADDKTPGLGAEILRQVFASMGQDASVEALPTNRDWRMLLRGELDGMFPTLRTSERDRICAFPDESLDHVRWVMFVRTADIGKLKFSSFDDLIGHDVAVREAVPGVFGQPTLPPELWNFLRKHQNVVETTNATEAFRMLAAGHVDYVTSDMVFGKYAVKKMGLSGKIEPLPSRSVIEGDVYVCFNKARVSPSFVDAFSRALKKFKQTATFRAIEHKYGL